MDDLNRFLFTLQDVWFDNVEEIASARIGQETVSYVSNIFKYYIAYRLVIEEEARLAAYKKRFG